MLPQTFTPHYDFNTKSFKRTRETKIRIPITLHPQNHSNQLAEKHSHISICLQISKEHTHREHHAPSKLTLPKRPTPELSFTNNAPPILHNLKFQRHKSKLHDTKLYIRHGQIPLPPSLSPSPESECNVGKKHLEPKCHGWSCCCQHRRELLHPQNANSKILASAHKPLESRRRSRANFSGKQ